jgi:sugar-specific transcriptional regulator TrmB
MNNEEKISFDILSEFGLTENQAKVFIATARLGNPTVSEIAEKSEVRREEVYRLLPELEKMGLIERLLGKPLRLKTPNLGSAITSLVKIEREKAKDRITELSNKSNELLQYLGHSSVEPSSDKEVVSDFSLIQEKELIRVGLYDMINNASSQLDILFSRTDLIWLLSTEGEVLQKAADSGVKIRIMSEPPSDRDRLPKILRRRFSDETQVPMKYILNPTAFYFIMDRSQLMFVTSGVHHLPSASCLWTNNESFVRMASNNFENRWHESVHWKTVDGIALSVSPQDGSEGGTSHVHRILLYESQESKFKVLFHFLKNRYDAGYMIIYVCPENCIEDIKEAMCKFGFEDKAVNAQKQIRILEWTYWMLNDGSFNIEKAIDVWDELYFEAQDLGFSSIAVASDMKFFFDNNLIDELEEYEKQIHNIMVGQMEWKCAYDEKSLLSTSEPLQLYARLLGSHTILLTEEKGSIKKIKTRS